jgi:Mg-chelatase subunit ChlD
LLKTNLNFVLSELQRIQQVPSPEITAYKLQRYFLGRPARGKREHHQKKRSVGNERKNSVTARDKRSFYDEFYDVAYVIDASGSIKEDEFKDGLKALQILISRAKQTTMYSTIAFSEEGHIQFDFKPPSQAIELLESTKYYGYRTNTQDALKKCRENLFLNITSGVREQSLKRVLVVTDGRSNVGKETTLYEALELKVLGIEVFVVAVGKYVEGIEELIGIATTRERHLFRVDSLGGFIKVVRIIPPWPAIRSNI